LLPTGHIAAGALIGVLRSRRSNLAPAAVIGGSVISTCLPDADFAIPKVLDRVGVEHRLCTGRHHSWATHTPLFWGLVLGGARRVARRAHSPAWAGEAADILTVGVSVHLVQDSVANTVALLWPLRRREYGLGLDRQAGETDHVEYMRRYPASPAGKLEAALVLAAVAAGGWHLLQRRRR
jgi:hypothetical protein